MIVFSLIGCNTLEEKDVSISTNEEEKPPNLQLTIGEEEIMIHRGAYEWRYLDKSTGQETLVQTDHAPPNEMVNIEQGIRVNLNEPIKLNFQKKPTQYEIRVWDKDNVVATYNTFEEIKEKGQHIFEIIGIWGESTATYVVALDLQ